MPSDTENDEAPGAVAEDPARLDASDIALLRVFFELLDRWDREREQRA